MHEKSLKRVQGDGCSTGEIRERVLLCRWFLPHHRKGNPAAVKSASRVERLKENYSCEATELHEAAPTITE